MSDWYTPFKILTAAQSRGYIGESISQLEHGLQAAHFATLAHAEPAAVIAALFHDIGHLCADSSTSQMDDYGVVHHEEVGAEFLLSNGYPSAVAELVRGHVKAKRYLVSKNENYGTWLSPASKATLVHQGGPMKEGEALAFEADLNFKLMIKVRQWDEMAKETDLEVAPLADYVEIARLLVDGTNELSPSYLK